MNKEGSTKKGNRKWRMNCFSSIYGGGVVGVVEVEGTDKANVILLSLFARVRSSTTCQAFQTI
jgi:hypothetical protein